MKLNLLTSTVEALQQAFDAVEHPGFFEQSVNYGGEYGIWHAWDRLTQPGVYESDFSIATIYGDGGFNRYFVYAYGSVLFSRDHATPSDIRRAGRAGFAMFEAIRS